MGSDDREDHGDWERYDERDRRTGKFTPSEQDEVFIQKVEELQMATTEEIAEELDRHHNGVRRRLKSLEEEGAIISKQMGGSYIWMPRD